MEILALQKILFILGMLALLGAAVVIVTRPTKEYKGLSLMFGIAGILSSIVGFMAPYIAKWISNNIEEVAIGVVAVWIFLVGWGVVKVVAGLISSE